MSEAESPERRGGGVIPPKLPIGLRLATGFLRAVSVMILLLSILGVLGVISFWVWMAEGVTFAGVLQIFLGSLVWLLIASGLYGANLMSQYLAAEMLLTHEVGELGPRRVNWFQRSFWGMFDFGAVLLLVMSIGQMIVAAGMMIRGLATGSEDALWVRGFAILLGGAFALLGCWLLAWKKLNCPPKPPR